MRQPRRDAEPAVVGEVGDAKPGVGLGAFVTATSQGVRAQIPPQILTPRDTLCMTAFSLAYPSVARRFLDRPAEACAAVRAMIEAVYTRDTLERENPHDPGGSLESYVNTIAGLLREHAIALQGRAWADDHVGFEALGFPATNMMKHAMFTAVGIATARAMIEARGKIDHAAVRRHMRTAVADADARTEN